MHENKAKMHLLSLNSKLEKFKSPSPPLLYKHDNKILNECISKMREGETAACSATLLMELFLVLNFVQL